ncbi:hypothetical protein K492DRAFT_161910 [Lichtheimia hyalospora FSU 10163]|nr:hypothetical protein K492DRAFT_161910 [Lichtheimia hyalospora FSU 10163]
MDPHINSQPKDRAAAYTLVYMSICLTCVIWQIMNAVILVHRSRKLLHFAVLAEVLLAFIVILCSLLNPLADLSCDVRYWVSIIAVNLGGCCIQSILLYKAYICYDHAKWLLWLGSFINCGYLALIFLYATLGKVPSYRDEMGNCLIENLEWPAIAKLGLDIASNAFLSVAFLMVIYRHYRLFGNSLHKSLMASGIIFSVGVIASNIVTGILIACKAMGGLSADLYSFDWVITGYLLIKQFKRDKVKSNENDQMVSKTMQSDIGSTLSRNSRDERVRELQGLETLSLSRCRNCTNLIYPDTEIININHVSK